MKKYVLWKRIRSTEPDLNFWGGDSDILLIWYVLCGVSIIPFIGAMGGFPIINLFNVALSFLGLNDLAKSLCTSCYPDEYVDLDLISALSSDMFRILLFTFIIHVMIFCIIKLVIWIRNFLDNMATNC